MYVLLDTLAHACMMEHHYWETASTLAHVLGRTWGDLQALSYGPMDRSRAALWYKQSFKAASLVPIEAVLLLASTGAVVFDARSSSCGGGSSNARSGGGCNHLVSNFLSLDSSTRQTLQCYHSSSWQIAAISAAAAAAVNLVQHSSGSWMDYYTSHRIEEQQRSQQCICW